MKLPEHERQAHRDAFRAMSVGQKLEYIFAYYKLPLVLVFIALVAIGSVLKYQLTHKDPVLYVGYANVAVEEELDAALTTRYVDFIGRSTRTSEVVRYGDLYLADAEETYDHQLSYASRLKLLAAIDAEELDVVLMNRAAYDLVSHSGYLMDLEAALAEADPGDATALAPFLVRNDVIIEDNEIEVQLGEANVYEATTQEVANALEASSWDVFQGLSGDVYLGIIGNTPRFDGVVDYLAYLSSGDAGAR